jgi:hypothetical protein
MTRIIDDQTRIGGKVLRQGTAGTLSDLYETMETGRFAAVERRIRSP